jgi:hypothetical protein
MARALSRGLRPVGEPVFEFGITASNTAVWRAAMKRVQAGLGDGVLAIIGDSVPAGAVRAAFPTGYRPEAIAVYAAAALRTLLGVQVTDRALWGTCGKTTTGAYETMVPGFVFNSGFIHATNTSLGGRLFAHQTTTGAMRWTPPGATFKNALIFDGGHVLTRGMVWAASTGANGSIPGTGVFEPNTRPLDMGGDATWIEFRAQTAAAIAFHGVEVYDGNSNRMSVHNCGWNGSDTNDWVGGAGLSNPRGMLKHLAPDLTIINLVPNDFTAGIPLATRLANLQLLINDAKLSGDCMFMTSNPLSVAKYGSEAAQASVWAGIKALCAANNVPVIDTKTLMGVDRVTSIANGYSYASDDEHIETLGAQFSGELIGDASAIALAL